MKSNFDEIINLIENLIDEHEKSGYCCNMQIAENELENDTAPIFERPCRSLWREQYRGKFAETQK